MQPTEWASIDRHQASAYRPAGRRASIAMVLVALGTAAVGFQVLTMLRGFEFLDRAGRVTAAELSTWQRDLDTADRLSLIAIVLAAVAVLAWQSRVVDNIPALTRTDPWVTPRWSIALWFIPLASFVAPYRIVADAWRRLTYPGARGGTAIVLAWWVLWLGSGIAFRAISAGAKPTTLDQYRSFLTWITGTSVINLVAGVLFLWIIREIERRSGARAEANAIADRAERAVPLAQETPAGGV